MAFERRSGMTPILETLGAGLAKEVGSADKVANLDARVKNMDVSDTFNKAFDPDKRVETESVAEKDLKSFDPDKRVEKHSFTTPEERIEFAKQSNGVWDGKEGNSKFHPNDADAQKALKDYKQDGINYRDGNPDFSKCSESQVKIDNMTSDRPSNFRQADEMCSKQWNLEKRDGRTDWSPRDVKEWRSENRYSWHERIDRKTMDLVQRDVHEECRHFGGVAECKRFESLNAK
jgi:hypothetical protein